MSRGNASGRGARSRGTWIRWRCSPPPRSSSATCGPSSPAPEGGPATSSTWAMACCRRHRSRRSRRWSSGCMAGDRVALLLMAYGGPARLADVEPYLLDVRGGRPVSAAFLAEITARYARIGGRSPILELSQAQAAGAQRLLGERFTVYVGMRHWHPYIRDVVERIVTEGHRRLVGVVLAPHYSAMSVGAYEKQLLEAAAGLLELALVRSWGNHPKFLEAVAGRVTQTLHAFPTPAAVQVLFTAHSLPADPRQRRSLPRPAARQRPGRGAARRPPYLALRLPKRGRHGGALARSRGGSPDDRARGPRASGVPARPHRLRERPRRGALRRGRRVSDAGRASRSAVRAHPILERRSAAGGGARRDRTRHGCRARVAVTVAVVGAGLSGLSAAWELSRAGANVVLLEAERHPGGVIVTERHDGFVVEGGPDGFLAAEPDLPDLARALGIGDRLVDQQAAGSTLWTGRRLDRLAEGRAAELLGIQGTADA